jgi:IclR family acetate operon transcriptional repressor
MSVQIASDAPVAEPEPNLSNNRIQSLERAFTLLELLAEAGGQLSLSELAQNSGMPLPTAHRALRAMASSGYVRQMESRRYALGTRLILLGDVASRVLGACAGPHLEELVAAVGETVNMSMLDGESLTYIAQVPSSHVMRPFIEVGHTAPVHCTAEGKVMLSVLPDSRVRQILTQTGMVRRTENTICDPAQMAAELAVIREQGYAVDRGEYEVGLSAVAVLVPDAPVPMAVSVAAPDARLTAGTVRNLVPALKAAGEKLLVCA